MKAVSQVASRSSFFVYGLALLRVFLSGPALAAPVTTCTTTPQTYGLCVMPQADFGIPEGGSAQVTFTVKNNTGQTLLLDYALATITHGGPDTDDFIDFAGANGANGLASAPTFLLPGASGDFVYNVFAGAPGMGDTDAENNDKGIDPVAFSIEMSPFFGNVNNLPNPNNIFVAVGHGFYLDLTPVGTTPNAVALNNLRNFMNPCIATGCDPRNPTLTMNATLYPTLNPIIGLSTNMDQFPAVTNVTVFDTPEPATWMLIGGGVFLLGAFRRAAKRG